jgi:uncharacterized damage-inducible protein DinB
MPQDRRLVAHLHELLRGGHAHAAFAEVVQRWPEGLRGILPPGAAHTAWQLLEHLRICQSDILEFSRSASHVSPKFPDGYWPMSASPPDANAWERSVAAFRADLEGMEALVADPATDLLARIPHGDGQTVLREALMLADHNAYHLGQLVLLRRLLGAWTPD